MDKRLEVGVEENVEEIAHSTAAGGGNVESNTGDSTPRSIHVLLEGHDLWLYGGTESTANEEERIKNSSAMGQQYTMIFPSRGSNVGSRNQSIQN